MNSTTTSWLEGTWKSNKERTIYSWRQHEPMPESRRSFIESELGKHINHFANGIWTHTYEDDGFSLPYRVAWSNSDSLFLVYGTEQEETGELLTFTSAESYWVHRGWYVEYFSKANQAAGA